MSSCAYLLACNDPTPPGRQGNGESNYDARSDVLAYGGSYQLPLFWISLFQESNLCVYEFEGSRVPAAVCSRLEALENLRRGGERIKSVFPQWEVQWQVWERRISNSSGSHFKIDAIELWDLDPDDFGPSLSSALRWISTGDEAGFEVLIGMAGLCFNEPLRMVVPVGGAKPTQEYLCGLFTDARPQAIPPPLPKTPPPLPKPGPPPLPGQTR